MTAATNLLTKVFYSNGSSALQHLWKHEFVKYAYRNTFYQLFPITNYFTIELSSICNANCVFCTYNEIKNSGRNLVRMDDGTFEKAKELMVAMRAKTVSLTPTFGETLVHKNWAKYLRDILDHSQTEYVVLYTNAIKMNEENVQKIIELSNSHIFVLNISTGGIDRDTYKLMFGVDRFEKVRDNIQNLTHKLKKNNSSIRVGIEVRLPVHRKASVAEASAVYNPQRYKNVAIKLRDTFDPLHDLLVTDKLAYRKAYGRSYSPCQLLNGVRCAADGGVWLCGCIPSEMPNDSSLRVGTLGEPAERLMANQNEIIRLWGESNVVPKPCQDCTFNLPWPKWNPFMKGWSKTQAPHEPGMRP